MPGRLARNFFNQKRCKKKKRVTRNLGTADTVVNRLFLFLRTKQSILPPIRFSAVAQQGFIQIIPLILLAAFAVSLFVVVGRIQKERTGELRQFAAQGPYPSIGGSPTQGATPTRQPTPSDPCASITNPDTRAACYGNYTGTPTVTQPAPTTTQTAYDICRFQNGGDPKNCQGLVGDPNRTPTPNPATPTLSKSQQLTVCLDGADSPQAADLCRDKVFGPTPTERVIASSQAPIRSPTAGIGPNTVFGVPTRTPTPGGYVFPTATNTQPTRTPAPIRTPTAGPTTYRIPTLSPEQQRVYTECVRNADGLPSECAYRAGIIPTPTLRQSVIDAAIDKCVEDGKGTYETCRVIFTPGGAGGTRGPGAMTFSGARAPTVAPTTIIPTQPVRPSSFSQVLLDTCIEKCRGNTQCMVTQCYGAQAPATTTAPPRVPTVSPDNENFGGARPTPTTTTRPLSPTEQCAGTTGVSRALCLVDASVPFNFGAVPTRVPTPGGGGTPNGGTAGTPGGTGAESGTTNIADTALHGKVGSVIPEGYTDPGEAGTGAWGACKLNGGSDADCILGSGKTTSRRSVFKRRVSGR